MKVASLKTHVVATPAPHIGGMYWLFVKLKTACGIEGVGELGHDDVRELLLCRQRVAG